MSPNLEQKKRAASSELSGIRDSEITDKRSSAAAQQAPRRRASQVPLDNTTKYATPRTSKVDLKTGEIHQDFDPTLKWQLQALARVALKGHRVNVCMRHIRADRKEVQVRQSLESLRSYYANLMACGSVWACPVCAPKIQHVRALEVRAAIDHWLEQGGAVVMPTHTTQHNRSDKLEPLLESFTKALRASKNGKGYRLRKDRHGIQHSIRALELTHGSNGWHPHAHTILFLDSTVCLEELASDLFPLWQSATRRAGLREPSRQAFKVVDASQVKSYITKMGQEYQWNAEHELVKAHSKTGSGTSSTPFDFLRANLDVSSPLSLARFAEFAHCFHGKRQLVWSNGAKKALLGHEGRSDQQIADSLGQLDPVLARITAEDWKHIRKNNLQGTVLEQVDRFGPAALEHILNGLRPPDASH